ncbi:PAQR family membrane homeostasis protein TrhA [Enterococcus timonensis]|uniref:PAQR family membrane homeostasis protein TrhA n=1 Tax=Enterococcus timonensis TaxID=1852364 RepID=UPI0008D95197|nr:hemolysin III family protein [Enterococcus timonensis]
MAEKNVQAPVFSKKYLIVNEVLNSVTHGIGVGFSIVGLVLLLLKGVQLHSTIHVVSYAIYGASLILLFLSSTLFHSLIFTRARKVFQVFDHCSIFVLIAGSYTPFCLLALPKKIGWPILIGIWALAIAGIVYKSLTLHKKETVSKVSTIIYLIMGWGVAFTIPALIKSIGLQGALLLLSGGVAYSLGAFVYSLKNVRFMHVVWHLFVLLAAALMYASVYMYT